MIITVTEKRFYTHMTTTLSLKALAEERGLDFCAVDLEDFKRGQWVHADNPLIVLHAAHVKICRTTIAAIKSRHRNSRVVTLGSDSIYYTRRYEDRHHGLLVDPRGFEFQRPEDCDLHLDLMNEAIEAYRTTGVQSDRWYWTASRRGLEIAEEVAAEPAPEIRADVICYANPTVSAPGNYRPRLTHELLVRGRSLQWGGTTDFVTLDERVLRDIYRLYRRSLVCLGTSSPSWPAYRAAKGWRDFFAASLGVPLIYDDLPEATDSCGPASIAPPPVETFGYEDWDGLATLLRKYDCPDYRAEVVKKQKEWVSEHVLERQFARLFDKYGLW